MIFEHETRMSVKDKGLNMSKAFYSDLDTQLEKIEAQGLYKRERLITSKQAADIIVTEEGRTRKVINFCANNYLGLADHPELIKASEQALSLIHI